MNQQLEPQFEIQKIYVKDLSFSISNSNKISISNIEPKLYTDLKIESIKLAEKKDTYETTLTLEVKVKNDSNIMFEAEVKQAGIFKVINMKEAQIEHAKKVFCPNIIYHYAREAISDLVISGGFPQLCLSAVNFDSMYQESLNKSYNLKKH